MDETTVVTNDNAAEFYAKKMGTDMEVKPEPKAEAKPEEKPDDGEKPDKPKSGKPIAERLSELTQSRKAAEARADKAERELAELRAQSKPEPKAEPKQEAKPEEDARPDPKDFADAFDYAAKLADWSARQTVAKALLERDNKKASEQEMIEKGKVVKSFQDRIEAAKEKLTDYDEVLANATVGVSDTVRDAIIESDFGPEIIYHLAQNEELATKLAEMTPRKQLLEMGRLEAKLAAEKEAKPETPAKRVTKAPAPINPLKAPNGAADVKVTANGEWAGSYEEYKRDRAAKRIH